jgi:hypothetical protein
MNPEKIIMTPESFKELYRMAAEIGGQEALKVFRKEQETEEKRREMKEDKVRKTKKLLRSYRRFKAAMSCEDEFTIPEKIELRWKFIEDLMMSREAGVSRSERAISDSEKKRQENLYCVHSLDRAIEMYRDECEKTGSEEAKRRYRELKMMYLEKEHYSVQEIAKIEKVSDKTVYKDLGIASGIVSVYLFGI